ncbi:hypothetical protein HN011_003950 [Eciton burchellii]|nr:hypothetical protein HN011_003950 [Eciton burchellii]
MKLFSKLLCFLLLCIMAAMCISIGYSPSGIREIACRGRGRGSPPANSTR